jgi:hypothetical protein
MGPGDCLLGLFGFIDLRHFNLEQVMKIYIASSWKNQHAVEMLTTLLRNEGHEVLSFVENNYGEGHGAEKPISFEDWVVTDQAQRSFEFDTTGATKSDMVIYIGPSGTDAWAEVGAAWASGVTIYGLWAKGEQAGLMRRMISWWFKDYKVLLAYVEKLTYERSLSKRKPLK